MNMLKSTIKPYVGAMAVLFAAFAQQDAMALDPIKIGDVDVGTITGYIRTQGSWNLQDNPALKDPTNPASGKIGGKGDMSMWRSTLKLEYVNSNLPLDSKLTIVGRLVHEARTSYLKDLNASAHAVGGAPAQLGGGGGNGAPPGDIMDYYNDNSEAFREAYLDIPISERIKFRFGKQQVVWGETDLLQAMDIVNPRDLSWRALFEPEDEEWRKPLIMANVMISVPEAYGSLQLIYRPGWDKDTQMGNTADKFGGRWGPQYMVSVPFLADLRTALGLGNKTTVPIFGKGINTDVLLPTNYHHKNGDTDDPSYGFRWTGVFGEDNIGYSLAYYHTLSDNPVLNVSAPALGIMPYGGQIGANALNLAQVIPELGLMTPPGAPPLASAEFILPKVDIIGATMNAYVQPLDIVFRGEMAVTLNKPYNVDVKLPAFLGPPLGGVVTSLPPGIIEKDTVKLMLGFDKQLPLMDLLGTDSASFWTVQIFDNWIPNFDKKDMIQDIFFSRMREHSVIAVTTLGLSYKTNQVQPGIALAVDTSNGGGVIIPSINLLYGDHWRLRMDAPIFFKAGGGCSTDPVTGKGEDCTHLFGTFDNNNQFSARLTYQF